MTLTAFTLVSPTPRRTPGAIVQAIQLADGSFYAVRIMVVRSTVDLPPSSEPPPPPPPANAIETADERGPFDTAAEAVAAVDELVAAAGSGA